MGIIGWMQKDIEWEGMNEYILHEWIYIKFFFSLSILVLVEPIIFTNELMKECFYNYNFQWKLSLS